MKKLIGVVAAGATALLGAGALYCFNPPAVAPDSASTGERFLGRLEGHVTLDLGAVRLPVVLAAIREKLPGTPDLTLDPSLEHEVVLVRVTNRPLGEVLEAIAISLDATWNEFRLEAGREVRPARSGRVVAVIGDPIERQLDLARGELQSKGPFDAKKWKANMESSSAPDAASMDSSPERAVARELAIYLPQNISEPITFATTPNPGESPLTEEMMAVLLNASQSIAAEFPEGVKVDRVQNLVLLGSASAFRRSMAVAPANFRLRVRPLEILGGKSLAVTWTALDEEGKEAFALDLEFGEVPAEEAQLGALTEKVPVSKLNVSQTQRKLVALATGEANDLSWPDELIDVDLNRDAEVAAVLADPVQYDPIQFRYGWVLQQVAASMDWEGVIRCSERPTFAQRVRPNLGDGSEVWRAFISEARESEAAGMKVYRLGDVAAPVSRFALKAAGSKIRKRGYPVLSDFVELSRAVQGLTAPIQADANLLGRFGSSEDYDLQGLATPAYLLSQLSHADAAQLQKTGDLSAVKLSEEGRAWVSERLKASSRGRAPSEIRWETARLKLTQRKDALAAVPITTYFVAALEAMDAVLSCDKDIVQIAGFAVKKAPGWMGMRTTYSVEFLHQGEAFGFGGGAEYEFDFSQPKRPFSEIAKTLKREQNREMLSLGRAMIRE